MSEIDPRDRRIAELEAQLEAALARIAELEARLKQDSSNSSKPPSSDPPWAKEKDKKKRKKGSGKKRGGQPGHKKHERALLPVEEVSELVSVVPDACRGCGDKLRGYDREPHRHQVWEVPEIKPHVTEYQIHALSCACGVRTRGALPAGVPSGNFGPKLMAVVALLTGKYRLAKRAVVEICDDLLGTPISLGAVSKIERTVSGVLEAPVEEAREYVRAQHVVGMDETGWREDKKRAWLWAAVTPMVTVFEIARSRGADVAKKMLGEDWRGVLITDRWTGYAWMMVLQRQLCWAHLIRDFRAMVERKGRGSRIGKRLLGQAEMMFQWWHRVRDGTMTRWAFQMRIARMRNRVEDLLRAGAACKGTKTAGVCKQILKLQFALWNFAYIEGVEPTNNASERAIRPAVLWRKGSFGTDTAAGSRFVERVLTVVTSLKQQKRHTLTYLTDACQAGLEGRPAPSILPHETATVKLAA